MFPRMYCSGKFFEPTVIVPFSAAPGTFSICLPAVSPPPPPPDDSSSSSPQAATPSASSSAARIARILVCVFMMWPEPSFVGLAFRGGGAPLPRASAPAV